ncbi:MAG: hypothetical protein LUE12_05025 [Ruminococcus sp.]|nr:hypothetical protein [Ruminococcus sp.]
MLKKNKKASEPDEAQKLLESVKDEPNPADEAEKADDILDAISKESAEAHANVINILVCALVIIFFGSVFIALTNHQDFTNSNEFSMEALVSGNYLAKVEKKFNESIPLQDYFKNAAKVIEYAFGYGNELELIEISNEEEDPYSIDTDNEYTAIDDSQSDTEDEDEDDEDEDDEDDENGNDEDDSNNKKITGITLSQTTSSSGSEDEAEQTEKTTINTASPNATTTTTIPPATTTTTGQTTSQTTTTTTTTTASSTTTTTTATTAATTTTTTTETTTAQAEDSSEAEESE